MLPPQRRRAVGIPRPQVVEAIREVVPKLFLVRRLGLLVAGVSIVGVMTARGEAGGPDR
jgi:hypothetical protein